MIVARLLSLVVPRFATDSFGSLQAVAVAAEALVDEPCSSGWHESSLDLKRGLDVVEVDLVWPETQPAAWAVAP